MKRWAIVTVLMCVCLAVIGCKWNTGDDAESWSDSYNWVNFSGTYRAVGGGILITDYTTTPTIPGETNQYHGADSATLKGGSTSASGTTSKKPIIPGSFSISVGGITISDAGTKDGSLVGSNGSGSITYATGVWQLNVDFAFNQNEPIEVAYTYQTSHSGSNGGTSSGVSGKTIYSFIISQQGQHISLTDNNGCVYDGYVKSMRSTSGSERTDETAKWLPVAGDVIVATFECSGTSAAGVNVKIVGTLQGTVSGGNYFAGRTMTGTWIEPSKTGDINGVSDTLKINVSLDSTTSEETEEEI